MVRLYFYKGYYQWDLISNIVDDAYQIIVDFYESAELEKRYGKIESIKKIVSGLEEPPIPPNTEAIYVLKTDTSYLLFIENLFSGREMENWTRERKSL